MPKEAQVVFLGRLDAKKGVEVLIRAAASINPLLPIRYHIIGDGDKRSYYELLAKSLGLDGRFHFWGNVEEAGEWLDIFDILVLPSYSEGMPLAVLEAMAAGLPVIASRVGGIPEAVVDGRTGYLFEVGDTKTLARYLKQLVQDQELRLKFGCQARERVNTLFNRTVQLPKITKCYRMNSH